VSTPTYPDVEVQLTGLDGNVFVIISAIASALRRQVSRAAADEWTRVAFDCESYDAVLRLALSTVSVR
jgi:hypothetical protein